MQLSYHVVDVFTQVPLEGNPLAVFPDGRGLNAGTMQSIARELNLSETTFVLPASVEGAAADVRIFTPTRELKFAGHPTIGTSYVLRELGIVDRTRLSFALNEGVGLVPVRVAESMLWLTTPPIAFGFTFDRAQAAEAVGLHESDLVENVAPQAVSAGNPFAFVALRDRESVDRAVADSTKLRALFAAQPEPMGIFIFASVAGGAYSRMFAEELGVAEDPATGSATGPLAAYMMKNGLAPASDGTRFVSEQGTKMGRRSLLHVHVRGEFGSGGIDVGGSVAPLTQATMTLPD